jgi:hypothetical protein
MSVDIDHIQIYDAREDAVIVDGKTIIGKSRMSINFAAVAGPSSGSFQVMEIVDKSDMYPKNVSILSIPPAAMRSMIPAFKAWEQSKLPWYKREEVLYSAVLAVVFSCMIAVGIFTSHYMMVGCPDGYEWNWAHTQCYEMGRIR